MDPMTLEIELRLLPRQREQLVTVAQERRLTVAEMVEAVVAEWLAQLSRAEEAKRLIREMSAGYVTGSTSSPGDVARNHDTYLYPEPTHGQGLR